MASSCSIRHCHSVIHFCVALVFFPIYGSTPEFFSHVTDDSVIEHFRRARMHSRAKSRPHHAKTRMQDRMKSRKYLCKGGLFPAIKGLVSIKETKRVLAINRWNELWKNVMKRFGTDYDSSFARRYLELRCGPTEYAPAAPLASRPSRRSLGCTSPLRAG